MSVVQQINIGNFGPAAQRDMARWYPLIEHPVQVAMVTDDPQVYRVKIVPAGRRSGKTERAKRYLVRAAFNTVDDFFAAAPTREQAKRIFWRDLKALCMLNVGLGTASESDLVIRLKTGSSISVIGLDEPARIEGSPWGGGVVDEIGNTKPTAWPENIAPALDTIDPRRPDYRPWCMLIGVPEGINHYFDLAEQARTGSVPGWKLYTWKSAEILPPDVIEAAKRRMSPRQFRQEYEASFETAEGRIYEDYGTQNITNEVISPNEPLLWAHDFNFVPLSSVVCVQRGEALYALDEIVLRGAVARQAAQEFVTRFENHARKHVTIYGDPAGRAGERHGHSSDYTELEFVLRQAGWTVLRQVRGQAPAIRDRQNAVRAKVLNAAGERSLFINPIKAPWMHRGLALVQTKPGSSFLEEESDYQHITTALGYLIEMIWPIKHVIAPINVQTGATLHHFPDPRTGGRQ